MKSKTIILSAPDEKGRGIMTLFEEDDLLQIRLRLYNVEKLSRSCKLGIYHNEKTYTANMLEKNGAYTSSMVGDFDIDKDFYSAIIDTSSNNEVKLSGGTYAGCFFNDYSVFDEQPKVEEKFSHDRAPKVEEKTECESEDCDKCLNCKYKEYFYSHILPEDEQETDIELKETKIEKSEPVEISSLENQESETNSSMLKDIIPQFEYIFNNYPMDDELMSLLPNGKFVRISENNEQYSLGALYEQGEMKYICYAVFSLCNSNPPSELGENYQWLPIDKEDPLSDGYYIVFQDANTLNILPN